MQMQIFAVWNLSNVFFPIPIPDSDVTAKKGGVKIFILNCSHMKYSLESQRNSQYFVVCTPFTHRDNFNLDLKHYYLEIQFVSMKVTLEL